MKEEFVPYDIALAMKELGFDKKCMMHWFKGKLSYYKMGDFAPSHTPAPLYQQAFRWFREKYNLIPSVRLHTGYIEDSNFINELPYFYEILPRKVTNFMDDRLKSDYIYRTYEEAQEACLRKLIEIVEENL